MPRKRKEEIEEGFDGKEAKEDTDDGEPTIENLPGIGPKGAQKLREAGYEDLMSIAAASAGDLMATCEIGHATAEKIIAAARSKLDMGFKTAVEILERRKDVEKITTGSKSLDTLLGGGVETQAITEAFGAFGSGKSQIGFNLAVNVQLPKEKGGKFWGSGLWSPASYGANPTEINFTMNYIRTQKYGSARDQAKQYRLALFCD